MKNLNFKQPYTDEVLKWDGKSKRYELTIEFVKQELDVHYSDDAVLEKRIKKNIFDKFSTFFGFV